MKYLLILLSILLISSNFFAQTEVKLDSLRFTASWFNDLDEARANPDKVLYLDLSLQKIKDFPREILSFKNLKRLYLPYNYWPSIPEEINALSKLEVLDLSGNYYLNRLPNNLKELTLLKELIIKDHRLNAGELERIRELLPDCEIITD